MLKGESVQTRLLFALTTSPMAQFDGKDIPLLCRRNPTPSVPGLRPSILQTSGLFTQLLHRLPTILIQIYSFQIKTKFTVGFNMINFCKPNLVYTLVNFSFTIVEDLLRHSRGSQRIINFLDILSIFLFQLLNFRTLLRYIQQSIIQVPIRR